MNDNNSIDNEDLIAILNDPMPSPIDPLVTADAIQPDVWGNLPTERKADFINWVKKFTAGISADWAALDEGNE